MDPTLYMAAVSGNIDVLMQKTDKLADEATPKKNTVLHLVSHFGKTGCVPKIISKVPLLICRVNSNDEYALHVAARKGHYGVVMELINCAASLELGVESGVGSVKEMLRKRNKHGDTALYDAVRYNHRDVVKVLISEDPEFSHPANNAGETPLYIAAERGYDDLVDVILETCTSPAYGGPGGRTALHEAIFSRNEERTRRLLAWKQSLIKETDERGWSPLHYAVFFDCKKIVSHLLSVDGSIAYLVDNDMNTGLHIAARQGCIDVAEELIRRRPDCGEIVNGRGQNMLHIALEHKHDKFVDNVLGIEDCIPIDTLTQRDVNGNTPLHQMAASNCYVRELIHHAMADKKALNNENLTPLDIAMGEDKPSRAYKMLEDAGATRGLRNSINIREEGIIGHPNEDDEKPRSERDVKTRFREISDEDDEKPRSERDVKTRFREISDTTMIVAALIATVTFTAGFTMPGGYIQSGSTNQGMAVLSKKTAFQVFIITDTIALVFSFISLFLNFLAVFIVNLRRLQIIVVFAIHAVVAAIGAMMVAFSTGTYVVLAQTSALAIVTCFIGLLFIPIYVFMLCKTFYSQW